MNIWRKFLSLLPAEPTLIGTVLAVDQPGKYRVQLSGDSNATIAYSDQDYAVSTRVFIRGDRIEREAPELVETVIDV